MTKLTSFWRARPGLAFAAAALLLTCAKVIALFFSDAELGPDESQYWFWSRDLDFGYFSKPPLIAWTIAATTAVFGNAEWAVRLAAPFFHLGAATFLYALGRRLYGETVGFWTGVAWLTLPGGMLSSLLITTDAPLLFFWSVGLYLFSILIIKEEKGPNRVGVAALLGAAVGLGMLAKYAMIYFPLGAALAVALSAELRRKLRLSDLLIAGSIAVALIVPNLMWNSAHDFQTLSHTAANANWGNSRFRVFELLEFLAAQFGVFGPVLAGLLIWGLVTLARRLPQDREAHSADLMLLAFSLPPLAIVSVQAFISRAHANWAAAAYPAALVLVTTWAFRARIGRVIKASFGLHLLAGLIFLFTITDFSLADRAGFSGAVKAVRGWEKQASDIGELAAGYDALLIDDREVTGAMLYYNPRNLPVYAWNSNRIVNDHYEAFLPYDPKKAPRAVFVSTLPDGRAVEREFASIVKLGETTADLKGGRSRTLYIFSVSGYSEPAR